MSPTHSRSDHVVDTSDLKTHGESIDSHKDCMSKNVDGKLAGTLHVAESHGTTHNKLSSKKHPDVLRLLAKLTDGSNNPKVSKIAVDET